PRIEIGSSRASAASTARTPASPSARPTAPATSRTTSEASGNGAGDAGHVHPLDVELLADRPQHVVAAEVSVREQVDVRERELGPGVDAQVRLGEDEHAGHRAVREDAELLAEHGRPTRLRGRAKDLPQPLG